MPDRYIWVERKFDFGLPIWMFPNTVERVRGGLSRVEYLVKDLSESVLTKRRGDKWSIQEHVGHLFDLESLWAKRLDELESGAKHLTAWEETNSATYQANHNSSSIDTIIEKFIQARSKFVNRLDNLSDKIIESTALHPRLQKPMRTIDLVYFVAEHDDHHLAEISRLKREFS